MAAASPPSGSVGSLHAQRGFPGRSATPAVALGAAPLQQSALSVETAERVTEVATSRIPTLWLIFCSLPIIGTALAAYQMHIIHTYYVNEDAPRCAPGDSAPKIRSSQEHAACLTAGLVSTVLTALILAQYLAPEALALTLGGLTFAAYWYTAGSSEAKNTAWLLNVQRSQDPRQSTLLTSSQ